MSRVAVKEALTAAVAADTRLKAVGPDVMLTAQKLPAAGVAFANDEQVAFGRSSDARIYSFRVRLYVQLGHDLGSAENELLALVDRLDENLAIYRRLTDNAAVIARTNGAIEAMTPEQNGPDLLAYEMTVQVEQRTPYDAMLTDGTKSVTIVDVTMETVPLQAPSLEVVADTDGVLRPYLGASVAETRRVSGRIGTIAEALQVARWAETSTVLSYTDIDHLQSPGWHILGSPAPRLERRNVSVESFDTELTLWRL